MAKLKGNGRATGKRESNLSSNRKKNREGYAVGDLRIHQSDRIKADSLVRKYSNNLVIFRALADAVFKLIVSDPKLSTLVHSVKFRVKDPEHLRDKLYRKCDKARQSGEAFTITNENLYQSINDLIGIRLLHLHTTQIAELDVALRNCLKREKYRLLEGPIAKTWDDEYRTYFASLKIKTQPSKTQYTSVHYVFDSQNDLNATFEVQVRTLAEELWGEVDHRINYPHRSKSLACTEQIAVLARVTSGCTRLVDSIFRTYSDQSPDGSREPGIASSRKAPAVKKTKRSRNGGGG